MTVDYYFLSHGRPACDFSLEEPNRIITRRHRSDAQNFRLLQEAPSSLLFL